MKNSTPPIEVDGLSEALAQDEDAAFWDDELGEDDGEIAWADMAGYDDEE